MTTYMLSPININDYKYDLPEDRIAKYPVSPRDASRLLLWEKGQIKHHAFRDLPALLPEAAMLVFNNTKVIPARLIFNKSTGARIEIFLLRPVEPTLTELAMRANSPVVWECTIGNLKRWPDGETLIKTLEIHGKSIELRAVLTDRSKLMVRFEWMDTTIPFVKIIDTIGASPLPPYLNRAAEEADKVNYQTVYSKKEGAVAAPTAGLHFTDGIIETLLQKGIRIAELTLHVSAGTFKPVKTEDALEHDMHTEQVVVQRQVLEALLEGRKIVAVGTTSMRTLESVYWFGVKLLLESPDADFFIEKLYPYQHNSEVLPDLYAAVEAVQQYCVRKNLEELYGDTRIFIFPGYAFKVCAGLITNFHQPTSTLLLLIAAFTGGDAWKKIYNEAMQNDYRFLSYGDSSLLWL